jgi:hypothetical protein
MHSCMKVESQPRRYGAVEILFANLRVRHAKVVFSVVRHTDQTDVTLRECDAYTGLFQHFSNAAAVPKPNAMGLLGGNAADLPWPSRPAAEPLTQSYLESDLMGVRVSLRNSTSAPSA